MTIYYSPLTLDDLADMTLDAFASMELAEPVVIDKFGIAPTAIIAITNQHRLSMEVNQHSAIIDFKNNHDVEIYV